MLHFEKISIGSLAYKEAVALRHKILREPLGLSFSKSDLANDKTEIILGAYQANKLIGILHLVPQDKYCKLRQMAIEDEYQGNGYGKNLVHYAETIAKEKGFDRIILHARKEAIGFYQSIGFKTIGNPFLEVGIAHIKMQKALS